jgi:hypothetical protein
MGITANKVARILTLLELVVLVIGGSVIATFLLNTSLLILVIITSVWLFIIFIEDLVLTSRSYWLLVGIGGVRLALLTGVSIVPIILAPYYSENTGL